MPDSDNYPTEEELQRIREWPHNDILGWFAFIKSIWWMPDWGWFEFDGLDDSKRPMKVYMISTGGWSGNESIIEAMNDNFVCWVMSWHDHHRGGHWNFRVVQPEEGKWGCI